jgi:hypothetical protein
MSAPATKCQKQNVCYYHAKRFTEVTTLTGSVTDNSALTAAMKKPSPHRNTAEI